MPIEAELLRQWTSSHFLNNLELILSHRRALSSARRADPGTTHHDQQMPRLSPTLIRQAASLNPLLPLLLRVCRDLTSARNELRWLQEHARETLAARKYSSHDRGVPLADLGRSLESAISTDASSGFAQTDEDSQSCRSSRGSEVTEQFIRKLPSTQVRRVYVNGKDKSIRRAEVRDTTFPVDFPDQEHASRRPIRIRSQRTLPFRKLPIPFIWKQPVLRIPKGTIGKSQSSESSKGSDVVDQSEKTLPTRRSHEAQKLMVRNVVKRSKGMPLQYILGTQPFGNLDILCRRRVLIPRPETEMYTEKVAKLLLSALTVVAPTPQPLLTERKKLRILDLCTGSGCIALLLHSILKPPDAHRDPKSPVLPPDIAIEIVGVDNSLAAQSQALKNLKHNIALGRLHPDAAEDVSFVKGHVLQIGAWARSGKELPDHIRNSFHAGPAKNDDSFDLMTPWDVVIANPPYLAPKDYSPGGKTEPSVRKYEPKEALVPSDPNSNLLNLPRLSPLLGDVFYMPLMHIARAVDAKLLIMEVGDSVQAGRVYGSVVTRHPQGHNRQFECWRDDGSVRVLPQRLSKKFDFMAEVDPEVSDRAFVVWMGPMAEWRQVHLGLTPPQAPLDEPSGVAHAHKQAAKPKEGKANKNGFKRVSLPSTNDVVENS